MRRIYSIVTFTLISISMFSQRDTIIAGRKCHLILDSDTGTAWIQTKTIKKKTGAEKFRGAYFEFYKSGRLKVKGFYKSGKRSDKWIGYYEDGNMSFQGYFDNGYKSDLWMEYFPGGHLSWKGNFFKDMRAGFWRYFYENGKLRSMTRYEIHTHVENVKPPANAKGKSVKINKKIHYSITPCDSLVEYYQDGTLKVRISYGHHGGLNGKCEYFYANGKKNFEGNYGKGIKRNTWNWFCIDGNIAKFAEYDLKGATIASGSNLEKFPDCIYVEIKPEMIWLPEEI